MSTDPVSLVDAPTTPVGFSDVVSDAPPLRVVSVTLWSAASLLFVRHSSDLGVMIGQWIGSHA